MLPKHKLLYMKMRTVGSLRRARATEHNTSGLEQPH